LLRQRWCSATPLPGKTPRRRLLNPIAGEG
jgi:hypothetical protein